MTEPEAADPAAPARRGAPLRRVAPAALAAIVNLLLPPLAHIRLGAPWRGLLLWLAAWVALYAATLLAFWRPGPFTLLAWVGMGVLPWFMIAADAARLAWRAVPRPRRPASQHPLALLAAGLLLFVGGRFLQDTVRPPFKAYRIPSGSMQMTLLRGDHLISDRSAYLLRPPDRGDLVTVDVPGRGFYVKRVIAVGGDNFEIRDKRVFVNGAALPEPYAIHHDHETRPGGRDPRDNCGPFRIPAGQCFLMGDNRDSSLDSRSWGPLALDAIEGRVRFLYWSWDLERGQVRWERIGKVLR